MMTRKKLVTVGKRVLAQNIFDTCASKLMEPVTPSFSEPDYLSEAVCLAADVMEKHGYDVQIDAHLGASDSELEYNQLATKCLIEHGFEFDKAEELDNEEDEENEGVVDKLFHKLYENQKKIDQIDEEIKSSSEKTPNCFDVFKNVEAPKTTGVLETVEETVVEEVQPEEKGEETGESQKTEEDEGIEGHYPGRKYSRCKKPTWNRETFRMLRQLCRQDDMDLVTLKKAFPDKSYGTIKGGISQLKKQGKLKPDYNIPFKRMEEEEVKEDALQTSENCQETNTELPDSNTSDKD